MQIPLPRTGTSQACQGQLSARFFSGYSSRLKLFDHLLEIVLCTSIAYSTAGREHDPADKRFPIGNPHSWQALLIRKKYRARLGTASRLDSWQFEGLQFLLQALTLDLLGVEGYRDRDVDGVTAAPGPRELHELACTNGVEQPDFQHGFR